ncbi:MAG: cell division protein FtsA [Dehalococcoidia bacterium]|nr:cell division protein FtsA [Dehalococcoidia bacterium]
MRADTFASIDVGTTKVCTAVAEIGEEQAIRILGVGVCPAKGFSRGMVDNIAEATQSIADSVDKAERSSGTRILSAHVGITGSHIQSLNNRGIAAIPDRSHPIGSDDIERVLEGARVINIPSNREVLHAVPRYYVVDGQDSVSDPLGMHGQRLDVETHIVTASSSAMQNLMKCVESAGVEVESLILEPLASGEAVLEEEERKQGVVVADIGGGTTGIAVYLDGSVYHTSVLPVGGNHLTRDLVAGLRCPYVVAEEAKAAYGHAIPSMVDAAEMVDLDCFGSERQKSVPRRRLCEILQARCEEIMEMVMSEVKRTAHDDILSAGVVLAGGTAKLRGLDILAEQVTGMPVRIGVPRHLQGLSETLDDPAYATSVGLLQWALKENGMLYAGHRSGPSFAFGGWLRRVGQWMRVLMPE